MNHAESEVFEVPSELRVARAENIHETGMSRVKRVSMNNGKVQPQERDSDDEDDDIPAFLSAVSDKKDGDENSLDAGGPRDPGTGCCDPGGGFSGNRFSGY